MKISTSGETPEQIMTKLEMKRNEIFRKRENCEQEINRLRNEMEHFRTGKISFSADRDVLYGIKIRFPICFNTKRMLENKSKKIEKKFENFFRCAL